jgi:hypothetical protein
MHVYGWMCMDGWMDGLATDILGLAAMPPEGPDPRIWPLTLVASVRVLMYVWMDGWM